MNIGNETEQIEFKKTTSEIKEAIISISSILNKHGKGTLYFGVKDNGDVIGQEVGKDTLRYLSRDISGNVKPSCWYSIEEKNTIDGKKFIEVQFSGEAAPYSAYGRYYERFADEDKAISDLELAKLFEQRKRDYSAWENEKSECGISDVDEQLLKRMSLRGSESGRLKYDEFDVQSIMSKFGLLTKDKEICNKAGEVLFSVNKPVILKLATFATDTKDTFLKLNHFEGNIYECIEEGIKYIMESIDWKVDISGESKRKETPEIPSVAIREIVINAFAHGQYGGNTTFEIDVFKNRVVIYSPGLFPSGFSPEDFAEQNEEPIMLNPKIVNVLFKTNEIESFGSGFGRTFEACRREGVQYSYDSTKSGFRFTFFRSLGQKNVHEMTKTENEIYEQIKKNNLATAKMISSAIGKSEKTVYRAIAKLKSLGLIERIGDDYNGSWDVK